MCVSAGVLLVLAGGRYMLLELVQGGELFSRLQNSPTAGRVSVSDARFYGACVLDAFDHLHTKQ